MPMFAIALTALIGIVATAVALAADSKAASKLQHTADSAAIAGATAFATLDTPKAETRLKLAKEEAINFAVANSEYTLTELDIANVVEDAYGQQTRIEVELEFQPANVMARVAGRSGNASVRRRAIAEATWGFPLCMLTLSETDSGLSSDDTAALAAQNCIVWSNSTASNSMELRGGVMQAQSFCAAGSVIGASRAQPQAETHCNAIPNPLASWTPPAPGNCQSVPEELETKPADELLQFISTIAGLALTSRAEEYGGGETGMQAAIDEANAFIAGELGFLNLVDADGRFVVEPVVGLTLEEILQIAGEIDNADPSSYEGDTYADTATVRLSPGTYCGLDVAEGHLELDPGVYHIKDAPLTVRRRGTLTGKGVTIILSGRAATFSVLDEARLTLIGPETGDTAGFALVEDVNRYDQEPDDPALTSAPPSRGHGLLSVLSGANPYGDNLGQEGSKDPEVNPLKSRLTGSGTIEAIGTVYLPHHEFHISGSGAGDQASPLLQIVADRIIMSDEGKLNIKFDPTQTQVPIGIKPERTARLVE